MADTSQSLSSDSIRTETRIALISAPLMLALQAAVFMVSAEARVIAPLLPAIAKDFQTTVAAVGLLITAYTIPYGLFQLVYGPLADRFSRQRVMGIAISLFAIGTFISGFAPNLLLLDLLRFLTGAAAAGVIPVALAYVGDAVPYEERQGALGRIVSIASLGGVLSAALGGIIAEWLDWRALFIGYGLVALLVGIMLLRLPVTRARPAERNKRGFFGPYFDIFQRAGKRAITLYGLVFFEGFAAFSTFSYLGALLHDRDGMSYDTIGILLMLNGVAAMIAARFVGRLVQRLRERGMLLVGGSLLTVSYLLVGLQPVWVFFPLAMFLSGAGFVIAHSTLQTQATELVPELRGTAVSFFAFALFIGGGLGTALAGVAIERIGWLPVLFGTGALMAIFTVFAGAVVQAPRARE